MADGQYLFTPDQLERLVKETLPADAKPGEKIIMGTVDSTGARVLISYNKQMAGASWDFQWVTGYEWKGDVQTGAKVIVRF